MKKINTAVLAPGDIVLTTAEVPESAVIRTLTRSDISHAMICVSTSSVMDSTGEGVHARNPQKMFYPDSCAIHVMRLRTPPGQDAITRAIEYIRSSTATSYDVGEAIKAVLPIRKGGNTKQFCSRLVARAYAHAGIHLVANPDYCTPQELKDSTQLEPVADCAIEASDDEVADMELEGDATAGMRAVTMAFVEGVRELEPKVESLNDAINLAIARPELDQKIAQKLLGSGYLDYWKIEAVKYPWRYDVSELVRFQNTHQGSEEPVLDLLGAYCKETLAHEEQGHFHHWQTSLDAANAMCNKHDRETLRLLQTLYVTLVMQHAKRLVTARTWLNWQKSISTQA